MPRLPRPSSRLALVLALVVAACNRDKPEAVPVQQGDTAEAPALSKSAPAPVTRAPAAPARPMVTPEAAASAELAKAAMVRTVQVASFPSASMAKWWAQKLQGEGIPAYVTTARVDTEDVHRLRIGAAVTAAEARALAGRIRAQYHWPTWVTVVDDKAAVTGAMLLTSRSYAAASR